MMVLWGMIYWAVLTFSFLWALQVHWSETFPADFNFFKYGAATLLNIVILSQVRNDDSIVSFFLAIVLYMVLMPIGILYSCQNRESAYYILIAVCFLLTEILVYRIRVRDLSFRLGNSTPSKIIIWIAVIIMAAAVVIFFRSMGMPSPGSFDLSMTYEIRSSYAISTGMSRLYHFVTKAIVPFLVAVCFVRKKYLYLAVLLVVQLMFFLWLANKTTIFSIAILALGFLVAKVRNRNMIFSGIAAAGVGIVSFIEGINAKIAGGLSMILYYAYSLVIRRSLFLPAYLKYCYYDFFVAENNARIGLWGTFIAPILTRLGITEPYADISYTNMIGSRYYGESSANTGVFGVELAHFGYLGIIAAGLLLLVFLLCVKKSEQTNGRVFTCCIAIYTVFSLTDSGAIAMIDFSPMLFLAIAMYFFDLNFDETIEASSRYRIRLMTPRRIRLR